MSQWFRGRSCQAHFTIPLSFQRETNLSLHNEGVKSASEYDTDIQNNTTNS